MPKIAGEAVAVATAEVADHPGEEAAEADGATHVAAITPVAHTQASADAEEDMEVAAQDMAAEEVAAEAAGVDTVEAAVEATVAAVDTVEAATEVATAIDPTRAANHTTHIQETPTPNALQTLASGHKSAEDSEKTSALTIPTFAMSAVKLSMPQRRALSKRTTPNSEETSVKTITESALMLLHASMT